MSIWERIAWIVAIFIVYKYWFSPFAMYIFKTIDEIYSMLKDLHDKEFPKDPDSILD